MHLNPFEKNNVSVGGNPASEKVLVFVHGFGSDQTAWRFVKHEFLQDYKIVLYDHTGSGKSNPSAYSSLKYSSFGSYADDFIDVLNALHLKNVIVIAHSVGSMITLQASLKRPELVSKLILIGASPRYLNDAGYKGWFEQEDLNSLYAAMENNYYAWASGFSSLVMGNPDKPELGAEFAGTLSAVRPDIALDFAKLIFQSDVRDILPQNLKETIFIQSDEDVAVPYEVGDYLLQHTPNAKLLRIKATGHFPHMSAPEEVIKAVKHFL